MCCLSGTKPSLNSWPLSAGSVARDSLGGGLSLGQSGATVFFRSLETAKISKNRVLGRSHFCPQRGHHYERCYKSQACVSLLDRVPAIPQNLRCPGSICKTAIPGSPWTVTLNIMASILQLNNKVRTCIKKLFLIMRNVSL
jgi:hypothetical protein